MVGAVSLQAHQFSASQCSYLGFSPEIMIFWDMRWKRRAVV
jgi:hypothetical protein